MEDPGVREAIVLYLDDADGAHPEARTAGAICEALGVGETIAERMAIVSELANLEERDLLETREDSVAGTRDRYSLTDAGRERAATLRDTLQEFEVEVVAGERRSRETLSTLAEREDRPVHEIVGVLDERNVYHSVEAADRSPAVGRDAELERCIDALDSAMAAERGRLLAITGPTGIGKSTLLSALAEELPDVAPVAIRLSRCDEPGDPYGALRDLLPSGVTDPVSGDPPGPSSAVDGPTAADAGRREIFTRFRERLSDATDHAHPVAMLDDLHRADPGTLAFLGFLFDRGEAPSLSVVVTYDPTELPTDVPPPLPAGDAERETVEHIPLGPLTRLGTKGLIERTTGVAGAPEALVDLVYEHTGGHPGFVVETVRTLLANSDLHKRYQWYPESADELAVPEEVASTVRQRLSTVDSATTSLLEWAAVAGERVPVAVLSAVTDVPAERSDRLIEALVDLHILEWVADGRAVRFSGSIYREAILRDLDPDEREHRRGEIARALEQIEDVSQRDSRWIATLAGHYEAAGAVDSAVRYYREAGERAHERFALDLATEHVDRALSLAEQAGRDSVQLRERRGDIHRDADRYDAALEDYRTALRRSDDPAEVVRIHRKVGMIQRLQGEYDAAIRTLERGLELARMHDEPVQEGWIRRNLGIVARIRGAYDSARDHQEAAREIARRTEHDVLAAEALVSLGGVAYGERDLERCAEVNARALELFEQADRPRRAANCLGNLGLVAMERNDLARARAYYERALDLDRELGNRSGEGATLNNLGDVASREGTLDIAREHYERSVTIAREIGDRRGEAHRLRNLALLEFKRGEHATAEGYLDRVQELVRDLDDPSIEVQLQTLRVSIALAEGRHGRARVHLSRARSAGDALDLPSIDATIAVRAGQVALAAGDPAGAAEHFLEAIAVGPDPDRESRVPEARGYLAVAALALDEDVQPARRRLTEAVDRLHSEHRPWRALALVVAGIQVEADRGATERVARLCERGHGVLETFDTELGQLERNIHEHCEAA